MVDSWVEAFENKDITAIVMCDQSAAFDVCDHKILLDKLEVLGVDEDAIEWFSSYLDGRQQAVYIDGALSDKKLLEKAGVPQGGTLYPLLYNIFCSDLPMIVNDNETNNNDSETTNNDNETTNNDS